MPHFVKQTKKNSKTALIMGRLTFESFGSKPLKGRYNIIVSKTMPAGVQSDGTHVFPNYYDAVEYATSNFEEVFSIGGHDIWLKSLASARRVFLTRIQEPFGGDTVFPFDELTKDFELTYEEDWLAEKDGEISSVMQIWTRKK
jgi:dihydrofolate reductase